MRRTLFTLMMLLTLGSADALAQFGCVDSLTFPIDNPPCIIQDNYYPVCGCDEVTYPNICFWQYAALNFYSEGPCEQVAMYFYPNPVREFLYLNLATRFEADVNLYIFDSNGTIMLNRYLVAVTNQQLFLSVYGLRQGLYIIIAESGGEVSSAKFMKWD